MLTPYRVGSCEGRNDGIVALADTERQRKTEKRAEKKVGREINLAVVVANTRKAFIREEEHERYSEVADYDKQDTSSISDIHSDG